MGVGVGERGEQWAVESQGLLIDEACGDGPLERAGGQAGKARKRCPDNARPCKEQPTCPARSQISKVRLLSGTFTCMRRGGGAWVGVWGSEGRKRTGGLTCRCAAVKVQAARQPSWACGADYCAARQSARHRNWPCTGPTPGGGELPARAQATHAQGLGSRSAPTCSTLQPIVGTVLTASPRCRRYRMVVLPALSSPTAGRQRDGAAAVASGGCISALRAQPCACSAAPSETQPACLAWLASLTHYNLVLVVREPRAP